MISRTGILLARARKTLAREGVWATARRVVRYVVRAVAPAAARRSAKLADRAFDAAVGVETATPCEVPPSDVVGPHWLNGVGYQAAPPALELAAVLGRRRVDYQQTTFVDLGAGKGRALLLASRLPFASIVGVEYSATLAAVARSNAARACDARIRIEHGDAASYVFPRGPLMVFLFNPFDEVVMARVVRNLATAFEREPRRVVVLYILPQPDCLRLWDELPFLHCAGVRDGAALYDTAAASP